MSGARHAVLVNGQSVGAVGADDRGLHYGDGLFETIACRDGRPRQLALHLARLARGCERLGLPLPEADVVQEELRRLLPASGRAIAKLVLTRGPMTVRGYRPQGDEAATRIVSVHAWPAPPPAAWRVGLVPMALAHQPLLAGLKHLNRLEQVLAQQAAAAAGLDEVILADSRGDLASGSMANLWVRIGGEWLTPPLDGCGVAGVTRARLLAGAGGVAFPAREQRLPAGSLAQAEAVAFSNVRLGLQAVNWCDGRELPIDPQLARARELLDGDA